MTTSFDPTQEMSALLLGTAIVRLEVTPLDHDEWLIEGYNDHNPESTASGYGNSPLAAVQSMVKNNGRRFMWWNPFSVTLPWLPRIGRGCDENCNRSVWIIVPFLGQFTYFWERVQRPVGSGECAKCLKETEDYRRGRADH